MTQKPRILIAEDHEVVRAGLRQAVEEATGWEVCGEASNGREAVRMAAELEPDVVILDIGMPELNGLEATRQIVRNHPQCGVLILTMHDSDGLAREVITAGAMGYVLKSDPVGDIVEALRAVDTRTPFVSRRLKQAGSPQLPARRGDRTRQLTPREREILQLIAEGRSSKEIAGELHISMRTVDTHRTNIMRKLDLHSAAELVRYAIRNRIALP